MGTSKQNTTFRLRRRQRFDEGTMERAKEAKCCLCREIKPAEEFYKSNTNRNGLHGWCKFCSDNRTRDNARKRLGVIPEQFQQILESQGKKCAICKGDDPGRGKDWNLDHDHTTGKVRGILCSYCNQMLGFAKDNVTTLTTAAHYLEHHQ